MGSYCTTHYSTMIAMIVIVLHIPMHRVVMFCNTYLTYIMLGFAGANALLESKADIVQLMC